MSKVLVDIRFADSVSYRFVLDGAWFAAFGAYVLRFVWGDVFGVGQYLAHRQPLRNLSKLFGGVCQCLNFFLAAPFPLDSCVSLRYRNPFEVL